MPAPHAGGFVVLHIVENNCGQASVLKCVLLFLLLFPSAILSLSTNVDCTRLLSSLLLSRGGATSAVVQTIDEARSSVLVQAYSFTSEPIAEALVRAYVRGVRIQVLLDKSHRTQKYAAADLLTRSDIPVLIDASHTIAHNKVMIIDSEVVVTALFNFTRAAEERNAENLLIIRDVRLAPRYVVNLNLHRALAAPFSSSNQLTARTHRSSPRD